MWCFMFDVKFCLKTVVIWYLFGWEGFFILMDCFVHYFEIFDCVLLMLFYS